MLLIQQTLEMSHIFEPVELTQAVLARVPAVCRVVAGWGLLRVRQLSALLAFRLLALLRVALRAFP